MAGGPSAMFGLRDRLSTALGRVRRVPAVPDGTVIYAVGDVHGRLDLLEDLQLRIDRDRLEFAGEAAVEVYLGDYFDRGPDSCGVVDRLIARALEREVKLLRGNHEHVIRGLCDDPGDLDMWSTFGGLQTMQSYGVDLWLPADQANMMRMYRDWLDRLPPAHLAFLDELSNSWSIGDYFFAHAGVRPGVALDQQSEHDLLWIRQEFLRSRRDHGQVIVHGHTPVPVPEFKGNRINIDTGAHASGTLTCLRLHGTSQALVGS